MRRYRRHIMQVKPCHVEQGEPGRDARSSRPTCSMTEWSCIAGKPQVGLSLVSQVSQMIHRWVSRVSLVSQVSLTGKPCLRGESDDAVLPVVGRSGAVALQQERAVVISPVRLPDNYNNLFITLPAPRTLSWPILLHWRLSRPSCSPCVLSFLFLKSLALI